MRPLSGAVSPRVLVTGASGFIGQHLRRTLAEKGFDDMGAVRAASLGQDPRSCVVGDIGPSTDWSAALTGVDFVVHAAGRAHVLRETAANPDAEFMRVNAEGTAALVAAAVAAGVKRVVYLSSIGVLGNDSGDAAFTAASAARPHNGYARSKLAGEIAARSFAAGRLEVVVLRLPLVYGPGVRANFLRLLRSIDSGWLLPLGAVKNRRSLVSVWNLCDLVVNVLLNPAAPGRTWMLSDGEDLSTPELIRRIGAAMGRRVRLLPVPVGLMQWGGALTGRQALIRQLCGSLTVDISATRDELHWSPPVSVDEGLVRTIDWFLAEGRSLKV
jgi:nucleoside-diphosphate-sugar epimerase